MVNGKKQSGETVLEAQEIRRTAITQLNALGITGPDIYLVDLIPLLEMIWADGKVQEMELEILEHYLPNHVTAINRLAEHNILTLERAKKFVKQFLQTRPDQNLLKTLRSLVYDARYVVEGNSINDAIRQSLLTLCIDIGAAAVTQYPFGLSERFNPEEKRCFFEILDTLGENRNSD